MATAQITITLPLHQVKKVFAAVELGRFKSVSGFFQNAVKNALLDDAESDGWLNETLKRTGGPLTKEERDWADSLISSQWTETTT